MTTIFAPEGHDPAPPNPGDLIDNRLGKEIINCTPHPIHIIGPYADGKGDFSIGACDDPPRVSTENKRVGYVQAADVGSPAKFPIFIDRCVVGEVENLPQPKEGTLFVVSRMVAEAATDRSDLIIPHDTVRDDEGNIIGCRGFAFV